MRTNSIEADRSVSFSEGMVEVEIYEQARILPVIWGGEDIRQCPRKMIVAFGPDQVFYFF